MSVETQTLNQYSGSNGTGNSVTIVATNMATACEVFNEQEGSDPTSMICSKTNIKCVLPDIYVTFTTKVTDSTGTASGSCTATPGTYVVLGGTNVIFTATAGEGFAFSKWQIDGKDVEGDEGTKATALLTIPSASATCTVTAVFELTSN